MAWLKKPLSDLHPFWEPEWGLHLLRDEHDTRNKKDDYIFGAPDEFIGDHLEPQLLKACFGEHRKIFAVCNNGTTAITVAMANAAPPSMVRLVGIGSYAGAFWSAMSVSSVPCDIRKIYKRNRADLETIFALPYLTKEQIGTTFAIQFEEACLDALRERLLGFAMRGTPVGVISLELVLSGNGLQLSPRFCQNLRTLCTRTNVSIVADEILTAFRCCSEPTVFLSDLVGLEPNFLVIAKFIGCGLVLVDDSMKKTKWEKRKRRYPHHKLWCASNLGCT